MRNVLHDESKDRQWPVGAPGWCDKVRIQPTIEAILDAARPATLGKGDQLLHGALKTVLIERIIAGDFRTVYDTLGALLGRSLPGAVADIPPGKSLPGREASERKPPTKIR
jgi:hypothetical protein